MAVTLYTPDTTGCFNPIVMPHTGNVGQGIPPTVIEDFSNAVTFPYTNKADSAYQYFNNPTLNPTNDIDAVQLSIGATSMKFAGNAENDTFGYGAPVLIATEAWNLTSLGSNGVTLGVYVAPTSACWTAAQDGTTMTFDSIVGESEVVPEPLTMAMLSLGIFGLGGYIRRRVKVVA
jgi:hypothetical protein